MKDFILHFVFWAAIGCGCVLLWLGGAYSMHEAHVKRLCYPEAMVSSSETEIQCSNSKIVWDKQTGYKRVAQ